MAILIPLILLINHPLELLNPFIGDGIAHLADSLDHIFSQKIPHLWVAFFLLFFFITAFAIIAVAARPSNIHEI